MNAKADIFQEVFSVKKDSKQMQQFLESEPELQWLFGKLDHLAPKLYDAYDAMFNSDKSSLLYTVGYNAVFAGAAAVIALRNGTILADEDLFEYLQRSYKLRSLYLGVSDVLWPSAGYSRLTDRLLMETDAFTRRFLPIVKHLCAEETDEASIKHYKMEYVSAMTLYGGLAYVKKWGNL